MGENALQLEATGDQTRPATVLDEPINLNEYEQAARTCLPKLAYDYIAGGAEDEATLARNRTGFARYLLRPRILAGIEHPRLETVVLGTSIPAPFFLAPAAFHGLVHPHAEIATARAAGRVGTLLVVSTASNQSLEAIATAAGGPLWFQLYAHRDRGVTEALVRRAQAAGYAALCVTVDTPIPGHRERDIRNRFALPAGLSAANFVDAQQVRLPSDTKTSELVSYALQPDPMLNWETIAWLRGLTSLPVMLKGIMSGEDAKLAVEHGAEAIIVSNHGGRQLDCAPSTIEVLAEVVQAVQGRCEVYLDGGIRRGTDIVKALALGARAVLIGRPYLWGLAVGGEAGMERVLNLLTAELAATLILCGCSDATAVPADTIIPA